MEPGIENSSAKVLHAGTTVQGARLEGYPKSTSQLSLKPRLSVRLTPLVESRPSGSINATR